MIGLTTGTPGAGKTLINVDDIVKLEKANQKNLILNPRIYENNKKIIEEKELEIEFTYLIIEEGTGIALTKRCFRFCDDYFELFAELERDEHYFMRSIYYNDIIERINEEYGLKLNKIRPVRTIYTNIAGLKLENIRPLPKDCDWRTCPDGSYIVIDEVQNIPIFSSESKSVDPIVKSLTVHRHRGFDIIGITQFPNLVHKNFIALVGHHRHLVNSFGLKRSTVYHWSTAKPDPNAFKNKATSEVTTTFKFPPDLYKYYKSATAHTHKMRLPWRFILMLGSFLLVCVGLFTCSMSDDKNMVRQIATGKTADDKSNTANAKGTDTTSSGSATAQLSQNGNTGSQQGAGTLSDSSAINDHSNSASGVSAESSGNDSIAKNGVNAEPNVYDPNDPFKFKPDTSPAVVNHRVFAGCFCVQKKCYATDQQGTILDGITGNTCRDLLDKSYNRPFDYFRQPSVVTRDDQKQIEEKPESKPTQPNGINQPEQAPVADPEMKNEQAIAIRPSVYVPSKGYE